MHKEEVCRMLDKLADDSPLWKIIYTLLVKA
jgi:hypothetical protein